MFVSRPRALSRLVALVVAVLAVPAVAQTPMATVSVSSQAAAARGSGTDTNKVAVRTVSPVNSWLSGQIAYRFPGAGDAADSFVVSARALYWLDQVDEAGTSTGWGLPVMGNLSGLSASTPAEEIDRRVQEVASSAQGMYAGVYPYWRLYKQAVVSPTLYAGIVPFKLNFVKAADGSTQSLYHGDVSLGVESAIGKKDGRSQLTVSVSGTYALPYDKSAFRTAFPNDELHRWSAEVTAVLPVGDGLGLLVEGVFPQHADPGFRAAFILSTGLGK